MSTRLRIDLMPKTWEQARPLLDDALASLRVVLDGGFRAREQIRGVVDTVIDTGALPVSIEVPGVRSAPLAVVLLRAVEQRTTDGRVISGSVVTWEWRNGALLVHSVSALAPATRYNVTFAVLE